MRKFGSLVLCAVLCAFALYANAFAVAAQTPSSAPSPVRDSAITALSVMGVVSELKADTRQVQVRFGF
jgi:hypothetical protein